MARRRVVVIGAGHNGLLCAAAVAAAGHEALVLEHAPQPGGALRSTTGETLPGFVHDVCAGFFPLAAASPAFRDVPLERLGVRWVNPDPPMVHPFADGSAVVLHRELEATARGLEALRPGAGAAWRRFVGLLAPRREALYAAAFTRFPDLPALGRLGLGLRRDAVEVARLLLGSAASAGEELFGEERATAWLAGSTQHSDLGPFDAGGGALALMLKLLGHLVGWPFPAGRAGRITDALVAHLRAQGGELRCGATVARIEVRGGRARGVVLAGGERIGADAVVATVSAAPFAALLPGDALPARLVRRLRGWRYGLGTFKLDLALAGPVPWGNGDARRAGVVQVGGTLPELARAAHEARVGEVPRAPVLIAGQHSLHDPSRAPAGRHTLYVYTRLPQRPGLPPEAIADRIEERIEAFAPGFRELVLARAVRPPARLEEENPSLVGGDLGGGSYRLEQQLVFRPAPELFRYRTPLRGLYLAGASTHPGGGVHGTPGAGAARVVLRDLALPRFRPGGRG